MNILALDSTAVSASVAVARDEKILARFTADNGLTHSELLLPMAEAALRAANLTVSDIDLFACTAGPGSFTGVRIGVSTVKGLAFGTGKPCVGVSTLEAIAENIAAMDGILCAVMDARRGQVYTALFETRDGVLTRLTDDEAVSLDALSARLLSDYAGRTVYLAGDGYNVSFAALSAAGVAIGETPSLLRLTSAASVAACAHRAALRGETVSDTDLVPVYLRLPQAERDRLAKQNQ